MILRIYWDDQEQPSVECPVGDFFCSGWNRFAQVSSLAVCVNPGRAFNCYWEMPFRKAARITIENLVELRNVGGRTTGTGNRNGAGAGLIEGGKSLPVNVSDEGLDPARGVGRSGGTGQGHQDD